MMSETRIVIPQWLKREQPICAGFCEMINETLQDTPNISLAEFAEQLSATNIEESYKRLQAAEKKQFGDIRDDVRRT